jgi:hypothetical protein
MLFSVLQQEIKSKKEFTRAYLNEISKEAVFSDRKRVELERTWPTMFFGLVQSAVSQFVDSHNYAKNALQQMENT